MTHEKHNQSSTSLIITIGALVIFGLIMLASASSVVGYAGFNDSYYFLKHQLTHGLVPGILFFIIFSQISYKFLQKKANLFFLGSIILLILVFIPGLGIIRHGAHSWVGWGSLSIQPSEIAKLGLLIYLAAWFTKNKEHQNSISQGLVPFVIIVGIVLGLIALQPDLGTLFIIALMSLAIFYASGVKLSYIFSLCMAGIIGVVGLIKIAPYRMQRLTVFLNPEIDPQGIGYHINQALLAIGSGGIFGMGLGHSRQKFQYLPEVAGDSIFAVMGEEFGFIITTLFVLVYLFFIFKIIKISKRTTNNFARLFTIGLAVWVGGQAFLNMGAMVGIMPLTGVPLALVSFGGTALMTTLAACGILVNINKNN
ncbi:MAG: putative lipid II flippase FtsW [Patescibacteria group bacterium]